MAYFTLTSSEHRRFQYLVNLSAFSIGDVVKTCHAGNDSSFPTYPIPGSSSHAMNRSNHLISYGDEIATIIDIYLNTENQLSFKLQLGNNSLDYFVVRENYCCLVAKGEGIYAIIYHINKELNDKI